MRHGRRRVDTKALRTAVRDASLAPCVALLVFSQVASAATAESRATRDAPTQSRTHSLQAGSLTPLQRRIETERRRLSSGDAEERRDAVERLGAMRHRESSRAAADALGDRSAIVRATAARAVLSLGPSDVATLLTPLLLRDRDEFVRREAAYALGTARNRESVAALVGVLEKDREASVRGAAAVALGRIGDPTAAPALAASLSRRVRASGIIARLTRSRRDEDPFVRRSAAVALGQLGSREGVAALVEVLSNERAEDDLRRVAATALGLIGDPASIPALRAVLTARDPHLSRAAYEALRKFEPASALPPA